MRRPGLLRRPVPPTGERGPYLGLLVRLVIGVRFIGAVFVVDRLLAVTVGRRAPAAVGGGTDGAGHSGGHTALLDDHCGLMLLCGGQRVVRGTCQVTGAAVSLPRILRHPLAITWSKPTGTTPGRSWLGRGAGSIRWEAISRSMVSVRYGC